MKNNNYCLRKSVFSWLTFWLLPFVVSAQIGHPVWNGTINTNWSGTGTEEDPYLIETPEQLAGFADAVNSGNDFDGKYLKLQNDLYMSDANAEAESKSQWIPIGGILLSKGNNGGYKQDTIPFRGSFDGGGHYIYNLYHGELPDMGNLDDPLQSDEFDFTGWYRGFFGYVDGGTIKNLHLENLTMLGVANVGGLVMENNGGIISGCSVSGVVGSLNSEIGGVAAAIVAVNQGGGLIEHCTADAEISGISSVGGIVGNNYGVVRDCSSVGKCHSMRGSVGGLVGYNSEGGIISDSHSEGEVGMEYYSKTVWVCGGFAGVNSGIIKECHSNTTVKSNMHGAGFCGRNLDGRIESCYSTGDVYVNCYSAIAATFACSNGQGADSVYDIIYGGEIINCFSTGKCINDGGDASVRLYGFVAVFDGKTHKSRTVNCYTDSDNYPYNEYSVPGYIGGAFRRSTEDMQSKAFVDTLNMVAALCGTSLWKYRENDYPVPTGVKAKDSDLAEWLGGGTGTKDSPFLVKTKTHLENIAKYVNIGWDFREQYIFLENDIALNVPFEDWGTSAPKEWIPIGMSVTEELNSYSDNYEYMFAGTFDGNFYNIENMYINTVNEKQGLFGFLGTNATIRNLGVTDAWIKAGGASGILAGESTRYGQNICISQCHTSGIIESSWGAGGILGAISLEGYTNIYNSYSSATIKGKVYSQPIVADQNYVGGAVYSNDTVMNFFFTGKIEGNSSKQNPYSKEICINCFWNSDSIYANGYVVTDNYARTTEYLKSREFVNELNYYVSQHNESHLDKLIYWQYKHDDYPVLSESVEFHTLTYMTNGGSYITPQPALDNSCVLPPPVPVKDGYVFVAWCTDKELTKFFDFGTRIKSDMVLYAKWNDGGAVEPDFTPFNNQFASTYIINTKEQLLAFSLSVSGIEGEREANSFEGKTVKLGADIQWCDTLGWQYWGKYIYGVPWTPVGNYAAQFMGTFEGDGHVVSGIYFDDTEVENAGFFSFVGKEAKIKNFGLKSVYIRSKNNTGALAGVNMGSIDNCYAYTNIESGNYAGGLVGRCSGIYSNETGGSISNSFVVGNVKGDTNVGGLTGDVYVSGKTDSIYNCYANIVVSGTEYVGGLIGKIENGELTDSYASGEVMATGKYAGGLVGSTLCSVKRCHASVDVSSSNNYAGGLAGSAVDVIDSYATGDVYSSYGSNIGGLCGLALDITGSYADGDVFAKGSQVGGLAGCVNGYVAECHANGKVDGFSLVGGLVGKTSKNINVISSYALGDVSASGNNVGGLIGEGEPVVQKCFAKGNVFTEGNNVGGLVGTSSSLTDCFAFGVVTGNNYVGGLVGRGYNASVTNCYVNGAVKAGADATNVAAVIAFTGKTVSSSYYNSETCTYSDTRAIGLTGSEMKIKLSYDGWNFDDIWGRKDTINEGYPYLRFIYDEFIEDDSDDVVHVSSVTLDKTELYLKENETAQLTATVLPVDAIIKAVRWSSEDPDVATVNETGLVTMKASSGSTHIVATTVDGGLTARCLVSSFVSVDGVTIDVESVTLEVGESKQLTATVSPENASNKKLIWYGSNEFFSVTEDGVITGIKVTDRGRYSVWVKTEDGTRFDNARVTVTESITHNPVTGIELDVEYLELYVGEEEQISATVVPEYADNHNVVWSSSDITVATVTTDTAEGAVSFASIKAAGEGSACITVETEDGGFTAMCNIVVKSKIPDGLNIVSDSTLSVYPNPVSDNLYIMCEQEIILVRVIDYSGNTLMSLRQVSDKVDLSDLSSGTYFIQIITDKGTYTRKILKI